MQPAKGGAENVFFKKKKNSTTTKKEVKEKENPKT